MGKVLYLVAGANGSGKSTISTVLLPQKGLVFVNPDDIAREMSPKNPPGVRIEAGRAALARMNDLLSSCRSFAVESTLSGRAHLSLIARARALWMLYYNGDSVPVLVAHGGRLDETHVVSPRLMDRFKEDLCPVM